MADGNTSVGTISLDIDLSQGLEKEIGNAASIISQELSSGVEKSFNIDSILKSFTNDIENAVKSSMSNVQKTVDSSLKNIESNINNSMKNIKMPEIKPQYTSPDTAINNSAKNMQTQFTNAAKNVKSANEAVINNTASKANNMFSSIKIKMNSIADKMAGMLGVDVLNNDNAKVVNTPKKEKPMQEATINTSAGSNLISDSAKLQMDILIQKMDTFGNKMEMARAKVKVLQSQIAGLGKDTGNPILNRFNTKQIDMLQKELEKAQGEEQNFGLKSDEMNLKLMKLTEKMKEGANATNKNTKAVKEKGDSFQNASSKGSKYGNILDRLIGKTNAAANSTKSASKSFNNSYGGMSMFFSSMVKWGLIFPLIVKGITGVGTALGSALMVNSQFANSLNHIKSNLMTAFMPIYQAVLPALNSLMSALATATAYIASFISQLFGKTYQQSFNSAKAMQSQIGAMSVAEKQAKKTADSLGGVGKSADNTADSIKKATEESKKGIAGFDEINKIGSPTTKVPKEKTAPGSGVIAPIIPMPNMTPIETKTAKWVDDFKKILGTLFAPLKAAWKADGAGVMAEFKRAVEGTKNTLKLFGQALATPPVQLFIQNVSRLALSIVKLGLRIYDGFILPILNWFIGLLPGAAKGLNPIVSAVTSFVNYLSGPGFGYMQIFLSGVLGVIAAIKLFSFLLQVKAWFGDLMGAINGVWGLLLDNPIAVVIAVIVGLIAAFISLYASNEKFRKKVNEVWTEIKNFFAPTIKDLKKILEDIWHNVIEPLGNILKGAFADAFNVVASVAKDLWNTVLVPLGSFLGGTFKKVIQAVIEVYNAWKPAINGVIEVLTFLWKNVFEPLIRFMDSTFIGVFYGVFKTIRDIIGDLKNVFGGIIDFIAGVLTGNWAQAWRGVVSIFKGIFGTVGDIAKAPLNAAIGAINGMISGLNSISINVPDWLGGGHLGFDIGHIPYLARGGIVDKATQFVAGENGKEAVMPLENNTGWITELAGKIKSLILPSMQSQLILQQPKLAFAPSGNIQNNQTNMNNNSNNHNSLKDELKQAFIEALKTVKSKNNSDNGNVVIQVDGDTFAKIAIKQLNRRRKRVGITELEV